MALSTVEVLTIVGAYAAVSVAIVGPLYVLVLRRLGDEEAAEVKRAGIEDDIEQVQTDVSDIKDRVEEMHYEVQLNADRSERNQRHIHQILLGEHNGDDDEMGNPHYKAEYCPLPGECPWCGEADE